MAYNFGAGATSAAKGAVAGSEFGPWGSAIGGTLGALGGFTGKSGSSRKMYEQAALQHYYWQQQMKTAHQLEAEDLKAAGFNPALTTNSGTAGNGIGSNKITPATGQKTEQLSGVLGGIFESIQQNKVNSAAVAKTEAETDMIRLQQIAQILTNEHLPEKFKAELQESASRIAKNYANTAESYSKTALNKQQYELNDLNDLGKNVENKLNTLTDKNTNWKQKLSAGVGILGNILGGR